MGYFIIFVSQNGLFIALYPTLCIKKNYKKFFKSLFIKSKKCHDDDVKNESAKEKN